MVFVLLVLLLALVVQHYAIDHSLSGVQEDMVPEDGLAEPDQVFYLRLTLDNTTRRFVPFLRLSLFFPKGIYPQDLQHWQSVNEVDGGTMSYSAWLRPRQRLEFRLPVIIPQRGRYILNRLTLYGGDFLGLSEQARRYHRFVEVVVPPKEAPGQQIVTAMGSFLGDISVNRFIYEDPVLTVGFREYTGREPMKSISWTQSAKGLGMMVKNYDYSTEPVVSILLNGYTRSYGQEEHLESCLSIARTVCRTLEDRRIPYDLNTNMSMAGGWENQDNLTLRQGLGTTHFYRTLELLGRATTMTSGTADHLLSRALGVRSDCGRILITTRDGMPSPGMLDRLQEASGGHLLILTPESCMGEVDNP